MILVSVLLLISLCIFAADFIPMITTWIKRIHIGRYTDKKIWFEKVLAVAEKNAQKLPKIPVTDKTAYTLILKLKGEYYNFYFSSWQVASLLLADSANESTRKAAYRFFDKEDWFDRSYKTGAGFLFYAMMQSGFAEDEKFKAAVDDDLAKVFAAAGDGTLPYVLEYKEHYVDTLGMVCPFLIKYHQTYGCSEALELAKANDTIVVIGGKHSSNTQKLYDISKKAHRWPGEGPTPCAHFYVSGWGFQVAPSLASDARRGAAS